MTNPDALFWQLRDCAVALRAQGFSREEVLHGFAAIAEAYGGDGADEELEDALLEVMDCLEGWCSAHMKIG